MLLSMYLCFTLLGTKLLHYRQQKRNWKVRSHIAPSISHTSSHIYPTPYTLHPLHPLPPPTPSLPPPAPSPTPTPSHPYTLTPTPAPSPPSLHPPTPYTLHPLHPHPHIQAGAGGSYSGRSVLPPPLTHQRYSGVGQDSCYTSDSI